MIFLWKVGVLSGHVIMASYVKSILSLVSKDLDAIEFILLLLKQIHNFPTVPLIVRWLYSNSDPNCEVAVFLQ